MSYISSDTEVNAGQFSKIKEQAGIDSDAVLQTCIKNTIDGTREQL